MHFGTKSYLKSTRNHTAKHALNILFIFFILKKYIINLIRSAANMLLGKLQNLSRGYQAADSAEMTELLGNSLGGVIRYQAADSAEMRELLGKSSELNDIEPYYRQDSIKLNILFIFYILKIYIISLIRSAANMLLDKLQNLSRRYQAADSAEMRELLGKSLGS
jgi:hypothetical protein